MSFMIKGLKDAFSDANLEIASRVIIKAQNIHEVLAEMKEDGKLAPSSSESDEEDADSEGEEETKIQMGADDYEDEEENSIEH